MFEDQDVTVDDVETAAHNSIARVFEFLIANFGDKFEDEHQLDDMFLRVLATITGETMGAMSRDRAEAAERLVIQQIFMSQDVMYQRLREARDPQGIEDPYDLANMDPEGTA